MPSRRDGGTFGRWLLACCALGTVGCGPKAVDDTPVGVTRRLAEAVLSRDTDAAYDLLGPVTRARLKEAAARATRLGGGKPRLAPKDMLSLAWRSEAEPDWKAKGYRLLGVEGDRARVEVTGAAKDQRQVVRLVKWKGQWRVELDLPPPGASPPR